MAEKMFTYQSSTIFYRSIGSGRPVILLHGFGEDGDIWEKQIEVLKENYLLIIPDLPGSGKSEMINDMSMEGMAELVKSVIEEEASKFPLTLNGVEGQEAEGVCLLGHSMGGYISLAFAEKYPELLSAFGLVHSSAFADNEEKKANRRKSIDFIKKYDAHEFLKSSIPALFSDPWSEQNQSEVDSLVEKSKGFKDAAIIAYYEAMIRRPDRTQVLKDFSKPVLFIIGLHDKAVPFEQSIEQCYLAPRSHIHILRNSAHMGMWEETKKLNEAVLHFIGSI